MIDIGLASPESQEHVIDVLPLDAAVAVDDWHCVPHGCNSRSNFRVIILVIFMIDWQLGYNYYF